MNFNEAKISRHTPPQTGCDKTCGMKKNHSAEDSAFEALLRTCTKSKDLCKGTKTHADLLKTGLLDSSSYMVDFLLNMYVKCGALLNAKKLLHGFPTRTVVCWNTLISAYVHHDQSQNALNCFEYMQSEGIIPNEVTFSCILKACGNLRALDKGRQVHDEIAKTGLLTYNIVLGNALVDMYAKCGTPQKASEVLEGLPARNVISWTSLISGYAQQGLGQEALNCFERMKQEGLIPNAVTFTCILKACGSIGAIDEGGCIHNEIAKEGLLGKDILLGNALVDMYVKCGALMKAQEVLQGLPNRDVVTWNALIAGYAQQGKGEEAFSCFKRMQSDGFTPNAITFTSILRACGTMREIEMGKKIHEDIDKQGLLKKNVVLGTALVDMYVKCGALATAQYVHDKLPSRDVVSWTALIEGYSQHGQLEEALKCFDNMQHDGLTPNTVTFACILRVCGSKGAVERGTQIHDEISKQGLLEKTDVLGTALVDMYARCGALAKARQVLEDLPARNAACWTALIEGYVQQGQGEEALSCFEQMLREGFLPDALTFVCTLKACINIGAVDKGEEIHDMISRQGLLKENIVLGTTLVDMYARCGALAKAQRLLEKLPTQDVVSWNTLIAGFAQQGRSQDVLNCFKKMELKGLSPDAFSIYCVLSACNHSGFVEEGQVYFSDMSSKYGIKPELEHYTCMIDLYGRAGHLDKAVAMIQRMPHYSNCAAWHALLGACRKWRDAKIGRWAFEHAIQVDQSDATSYVLMANLYADVGMQEEVKDIEVMRVENKAFK